MRSNRRTFFKALSTGAAGLTLGTAAPVRAGGRTTHGENGDADGPVLRVGDDIAVTETTSGKVRGYVLRDIYYFLGVPYGADTSGPNRFMPPQKPKSWTDVYPALWWGNTAPQNMDNRYANKFYSFRDHWNYDDVSEDCLRINVFTPALKDGKKRPVLLWLHGGGYTAGNGIEHDGYNGENLARFGDIVFCSINHRLGPLGYCNLAGVGGERYAASGNAGMLDIVASLEWVRDNIANFGGDPGNVTIMGQSGGGAKVCVLTAMPSAKGLFHKAVVLSGASVRAGDKEYAEKLGAYVVKEAGLALADIDKLQALAVEGLLRHRHEGAAQTRRRNGVRWWCDGRPAVRLQSVSGRPFPAAAPLRAGRGTDGRGCADDHLLYVERDVAGVARRVGARTYAATSRGSAEGARGLWSRAR